MRSGADPSARDGERPTPEGGQPTPVTERGAQTRERLIAAAREVFEERGFIDTRVAHITRHARVSYGSFYTYFPSKEAVFLEIADRLFEGMTRHAVVPSPSAAPSAEVLSPAVRIRRANGAYYQAYLRNAKMMAIIEQVATFNEEFQEMRRKHRAVSVGRSAKAIERWQRAGLVAADLDPEMTARALAAMVDHSLYLWLVQGEDPPGTERLLDTLDTLSIRALGLLPDAIPPAAAPDTTANAASGAALGAALAARLADLATGDAEVTGLRRLTGGASRETWAFDAGGRALVLRRDPSASPDPATMAREAALLTVAADAGVPVPGFVDHGRELLGSPYLIMERLDGETIPRRLLRDGRFANVRPRLARELGTILARLHTIPPHAVPGLPDGDPLDDIATCYEGFAEARPTVELALRWLDRRRPAASVGRSVVHGDFRNGNLMIDPSGVRGVLDWELAHVGDPAEDLGWMCVKAWRFGAPDPVGGFGTRAALLEGYAAAGGTPPTPEALHWWEVYGTLRWTILCRYQAERYLDGSDPSIEYAMLGRRVCEQEHDLLLALGLTSPVTVPDPLGSSSPGTPSVPHDRPSAAALIDAVGAFLDGADQPYERLRFHARVAASALRIARRELLLGDTHWVAHRERLHNLGCATDADLALGIRTGKLDDRMDEVVATVRASVIDKLTVANPRYLAFPA